MKLVMLWFALLWSPYFWQDFPNTDLAVDTDHRMCPLNLSTLIAPGWIVSRRKRWMTPSSPTRKFSISSTRLLIWSSLQCRWIPVYDPGLLFWYESNLFLSGLDHLFNLGFEKSHRKLRPGGLCSHPARPWVQHWLDACSINGAHGLPWSSRGNKWTIQPYFCLLMLYLMIWGFVMVNFHSWFEFNILCANCLRKRILKVYKEMIPTLSLQAACHHLLCVSISMGITSQKLKD